jgi:DNA-binding transcriptional ArsR family regulator
MSFIQPSLRSLSAGSSGGMPQPAAPMRPGRATSPSSDTPIDNTSFRIEFPIRYIVHRSVHYNPALDRTFFALSDPTRRGILERLGRGPATIGELAEPFGLTINGLKKHVGVLEEVDLVVTAKVGRARECRLGPARLEDATGWIDEYRRTWQRRLDRFGSYVEKPDAVR